MQKRHSFTVATVAAPAAAIAPPTMAMMGDAGVGMAAKGVMMAPTAPTPLPVFSMTWLARIAAGRWEGFSGSLGCVGGWVVSQG